MAQAMGERILRKEDDRFLMGRGSYVADMTPPGTVYAKFVRSPYAHARLVRIDATKALAVPGVIGVFTAMDFKGEIGNVPTAWAVTNADIKTPPYPALAKEWLRLRPAPARPDAGGGETAPAAPTARTGS